MVVIKLLMCIFV